MSAISIGRVTSVTIAIRSPDMLCGKGSVSGMLITLDVLVLPRSSSPNFERNEVSESMTFISDESTGVGVDTISGSSTSIGSSSIRASLADAAAETITDGETESGNSSLSGVGVLEREGGGHELLLLLMLELPLFVDPPLLSLLSLALSLSRSTEQGLTLLLLLLPERADDEFEEWAEVANLSGKP